MYIWTPTLSYTLVSHLQNYFRHAPPPQLFPVNRCEYSNITTMSCTRFLSALGCYLSPDLVSPNLYPHFPHPPSHIIYDIKTIFLLTTNIFHCQGWMDCPVARPTKTPWPKLRVKFVFHAFFFTSDNQLFKRIAVVGPSALRSWDWWTGASSNPSMTTSLFSTARNYGARTEPRVLAVHCYLIMR